MDQKRVSPNPTQHRLAPAELEANGNIMITTATTPIVTPLVHPLIIPQFVPLYFPIGFMYPFPAVGPWWYSNLQLSMMGVVQPMLPWTSVIPPSTTSQNPVEHCSTDAGVPCSTSITNNLNLVITNEIGNDNSTNLKIHKNGYRNANPT